MSEYVCVKCGRMFKKSSHLKNHHNKKIPCVQEILIKDGTVIMNWHHNNFPTYSDVKQKFMK